MCIHKNILLLLLSLEKDPETKICSLHQIEGLPLLHFSLSLADFKIHQSAVKECFEYLYQTYGCVLGEQIDRLGRNVVHLIIENDLDFILEVVISSAKKEEFATLDNNGKSPFDYFYIY